MPKPPPIEEIIVEEDQEDLSRHPSTCPEWQHITPKPPPPASQLVASIKLDLYTEDVMSCFWAAVANNDLTDRMLTLTEEIILQINAAHYTVWAWRWKCVEALGGVALFPHLAAQERQLMFAVAASNAKNYQLWNHRRKYALARGRGSDLKHLEEELEFSAGCLELDAKNYHAWAHRQAVIKQCVEGGGGDYEIKLIVLEKELKYTDTLLEIDLRNNSAWSQRAFLLPLLVSGAAAAREEKEEENNGNASSTSSSIPLIKSEVEYSVDKIHIAPHNESAWNYLRYLAHFNSSSTNTTVDDEYAYEEIALTVLDTRPWCSPALEFLADLHSERAMVLLMKMNSKKEEGYVVTVNLATVLYNKLIKLNPVKAPYFRYRIARLLS